MEYSYNDTELLAKEARRREKSALRISASKLGILLLLYSFVFQYYTRYIFYFLYRLVTGHSITELKSVSSALSMGFSCFVVAASLVCAVVTLRLMGVNVLTMLKADKKAVGAGFIAFPAALLANSVITTAVSVVTKILASTGTKIPEADFSVGKADFQSVFLTALYLIVVAPVAEEIIYRGAVLKLIAPFGKKPAIILSALIFGLMHGNLPQCLGAFAIGIIFAAVDVKYNSIVPSIIMHMLNNFLPTLTNINSAINSPVISVVYKLLFYACIFLGVTVVIYLIPKFRISDDESNYALGASQRARTIFFNIPVLLYIIILTLSLIFEIVKANI